MIITQSDLSVKLYDEVIEEITRADSSIVNNCIKNAIALAKAYMPRFDLDKLFGIGNAAPEVSSDFLKNIVIDITCWYLVRKANPNVNMETFRIDFEDAQKNLDKALSGKLSPPEWPLKPVNAANDTHPGETVTWSSNPKRNNHF